MRLYGLAAIAGLAAAGSLRAAELLLGPLNTVIMGIAMMAVPEAAVLLRRSTRRLQPFCMLLSCLGAGGALAWGMVLLLLPDSVGQQILHSAWYAASALLVPVTLAVAGFGFSVGAWAGVRALGAASRSLRAQGIGSVVYLTGALGGAATRRCRRRGLGFGGRDPDRSRRLVVGTPPGRPRALIWSSEGG